MPLPRALRAGGAAAAAFARAFNAATMGVDSASEIPRCRERLAGALCKRTRAERVTLFPGGDGGTT